MPSPSAAASSGGRRPDAYRGRPAQGADTLRGAADPRGCRALGAVLYRVPLRGRGKEAFEPSCYASLAAARHPRRPLQPGQLGRRALHTYPSFVFGRAESILGDHVYAI